MENIEFAENIIKACCVLHNYVRLRDGYRYEDTLFETALDGLSTTTIQPARLVNINKSTSLRELSDLIEYLDLTKEKVELLGPRLKQQNLLQPRAISQNRGPCVW
ncbi:unnamed protein product [Acanthoscelides obtectus]|uniref:Uncharacterized protein n=1 Tax=Acanthoscelides obtectus TaxID=200917 RepID=A0A9P0M8J6_ACAOB|nr:unnamed protein product [Acanthoscelides obtectus]CAK1642469.1 hypothetical protein AOBTE_LOCUS13043 [Acanthoscelides obtectus]